MSKQFCTNCGQELSADAKFCPNCGMGVPQQQAAETNAAPVAVDSVPAPAVPEALDPKAGKKRQKKEQVDYEALLMANMPTGVRQRKPFATFALAGVGVLVAIVMLCATGSFNPDPEVYIRAGAEYRPLILEGQLWRLVTGTFLHFGLQHLLFNMLCLFALGRFLEKVAGHVNLLCVYLLTACTGGLLSMAFHGRDVCAGASGAVFGVFGASVSLVAFLWRKYHIDPKHMWGYMKNGLAFVGINFIYSLFPGVDMAGHIGGLLGGLAVGAVVAVPLLMDGKPFAKWFQRGFWGVSALLAVILACTTACGVKARGFGGGSNSSSSSRDDYVSPNPFSYKSQYQKAKPAKDQPAPQKERARLADEEIERSADRATSSRNFMNDLIKTSQESMSGSIAAGVRKLRTEAERGDANAQCRLAWCYLNAHGVEKDMNEAFRWYRKAAEQGNAEAQNEVGASYLYGVAVEKDPVEAVRWYRKSASQGFAAAQASLGACYLDGVGVSKDEAEAVFWLRKSAAQGYPNAQYLLGLCFDNGWGVAQDKVETVRLYRMAAAQGFAAAECDLGFCYLNGQGVEKDMSAAFRWFNKAAEQGHALAQNNIGACYANGWAVPPNNVEAVKWYRKAANQGLALAQRNLGLCYLNGLGVVKDVNEAKRWLRMAAQQGDQDAVNELNNIKGDEMLRQMSLE